MVKVDGEYISVVDDAETVQAGEIVERQGLTSKTFGGEINGRRRRIGIINK